MLRISRFAGYVLLAGSALFVLSAMLAVPPPPLTALRNISIPVDAQIEASVFSAPKKPGELRLAFMSNCLFQGAVRNGARTAKLPVGVTIVGRFENWVSRQPELAQLPVSVFNASMDGTAILDHIAMTHKLAQYGVDVLVIAMAYTEFRRLPLHPQLGNLKESLTQHGVERADIDDLSKSRGRVLSMDFQRWVTARKFDFYNANPMLVNVLLWNYDVRKRIETFRSASRYEKLFGGPAIPVFHIGLRAKSDQSYRPYIDSLIKLAASEGIHVVLVNQPIRFKEAIEESTPNIFAEHAAHLRATAAADHCTLIDLDAAIQVEEYLSDYIHLTYTGVRVVSEFLNPAIGQILESVVRARPGGQHAGKPGSNITPSIL